MRNWGLLYQDTDPPGVVRRGLRSLVVSVDGRTGRDTGRSSSEFCVTGGLGAPGD